MYNGSTFQRGLLLHLFFGFSYDLQVRCKTYSATLLFGQITLLRHWRAKRLRPTRKQGKTMNKHYYDDGRLKITKNYISLNNGIIPTNALSFISTHKKDFSWLKPMLMILAGVILILIDNFETKLLIFVSCLSIFFGVLGYLIAFLQSRERVIYFVSHAGKSILYKINSEQGGEEIINAIHELLNDEDLSL